MQASCERGPVAGLARGQGAGRGAQPSCGSLQAGEPGLRSALAGAPLRLCSCLSSLSAALQTLLELYSGTAAKTSPNCQAQLLTV